MSLCTVMKVCTVACWNVILRGDGGARKSWHVRELDFARRNLKGNVTRQVRAHLDICLVRRAAEMENSLMCG